MQLTEMSDRRGRPFQDMVNDARRGRGLILKWGEDVARSQGGRGAS